MSASNKSEPIDAIESPDNFRKMEKEIRLFVKTTCGGKEFIKRVKKNDQFRNLPNCHPSIGIADIVDYTRPDDRLLLVDEFSTTAETVYTLSSAAGHPSGLFIIPGVLSPEQQLHWAREALETYSAAEHTNLSNLENLRRTEKADSLENANATEGRIWEHAVCQNNDLRSLVSLRWASLGYHYNWTDRCYQEHYKSPFPTDLASLCCELAEIVGCSLKPEAAIVNYYPAGSCMGGHLDDAELTMDEPIVSISIGRAAIFMIGGRTKEICPVPIVVRSGDVVIMSGESRYCYHGVPHIFTADEEAILFPSVPYGSVGDICSDDVICTKETPEVIGSEAGLEPGSRLTEDTIVKNVKKYIQISRININVRQVMRNDGVWVNKAGSGAMKSLPSV